jgi:hypothetical protein
MDFSSMPNIFVLKDGPSEYITNVYTLSFPIS